MNRNSENHFAEIPSNLEISRSKFDRSYSHKTTFNTGDLIPIYFDEVLPGDTFQVDTAAAIRMSTPIFPIMDNMYLDTYFFFVPNRLVWNHWKEFMGENRLTAWEQPTEYQIPQITAPTGGWEKGTIADYFGIPTKVGGISVSALPFRAYAEIWNNWFRDQNLKDAAMVNMDETTVTGSNSGDYVINAQLGAKPLKAAKFHDYFTSALPQPQKGPDVQLPLGSIAPVYTYEQTNDFNKYPKNIYNNASPIQFSRSDNGAITGRHNLEVSDANGVYNATATSSGSTAYIIPRNLYASLDQATAATINQLRQAFAVQRFFERQARSGSRYHETIRAFFGVTVPDARVQIPEYLGGTRVRVNVDQVVQSSATDDVSPQGNVSGWSLTNFVHEDFTKSFTEHGMVIGVACIRTDNTYQQGINRMWSRKTKLDYFWPTFAHLGEMAVLNKEIYAQGNNTTDEEVFGYQEAWAEYRYRPSHVTGAFRSNYAQSLDSWHYAYYYGSQPYLSSAFVDEPLQQVDRTLAVTSSVEDQFIADFYFQNIATRPMPVYSIPGLIDHM